MTCSHWIILFDDVGKEIMTVQRTDTVLYEGKDYTLIASCGEGMITPAYFGINPSEFCTGCYVEYTILNDKLLLTKMHVADRDDMYPVIYGVEARAVNEFVAEDGTVMRSLEHIYEGLCDLVSFSGGLLIGHGATTGLVRQVLDNIGSVTLYEISTKPDVLQKLKFLMGFQKVTSFHTVHELLIDNGTVKSMVDHSEDLFQLRSELNQQPTEFEDLMAWINDMFSLDYFI